MKWLLLGIWIALMVLVLLWEPEELDDYDNDSNENNDLPKVNKDDLVKGPNATAWQARSYDDYDKN